MKNNRILVTGTFNTDDTVTYKVQETIFTGEGTLDFTLTTTHEGVTSEVLSDEDDDLTCDFFKNLFSKEGFDFDCFID